MNNATDSCPAAQSVDFLQPDMLDYGYLFGHDNEGEALNESMDPQCAVMADSNPYMRRLINGEQSHGPQDPHRQQEDGR